VRRRGPVPGNRALRDPYQVRTVGGPDVDAAVGWTGIIEALEGDLLAIRRKRPGSQAEALRQLGDDLVAPVEVRRRGAHPLAVGRVRDAAAVAGGPDAAGAAEFRQPLLIGPVGIGSEHGLVAEIAAGACEDDPTVEVWRRNARHLRDGW
jgi:hypothetical protein